MHIWLKGILAAAISGGAGGVLTRVAAVGIDPERHAPRSRSRARPYEREQLTDRHYEQWAYDVLDTVPAFHKQPFVTVS